MTSEKTIMYIINLFLNYLDELSTLPRNDFIHGEMTAYIETLEIIQNWDKAKSHNLNFDIENKYKI